MEELWILRGYNYRNYVGMLMKDMSNIFARTCLAGSGPEFYIVV